MSAPVRQLKDADESGLYTALNDMLKEKEINKKEIASILNIHVSGAGRKIKCQNFTPSQCQKLHDYMGSKGRVLSGATFSPVESVPHLLYIALLGFYGIEESREAAARAECVGTYSLWRRSVDLPDYYVHGRVDIRAEKGTRALTVRMRQARRGGNGTPPIEELYFGYWIAVREMYAMMLHDEVNRDLRMTIFNRHRSAALPAKPGQHLPLAFNRRRLVEFNGRALGMDGRSLFSGPVHMVRVDDPGERARLDQEIDVVPERHVPESILARLKREPFVVQ